jgi:Zn-dependent protease
MLATPARLPAATLGMVRAGSRRVSLAWAGPVPRRVAALLGPPPRSRVLLAAAVLIVLLTGASAVQAARDLHALLELAQAGR